MIEIGKRRTSDILFTLDNIDCFKSNDVVYGVNRNESRGLLSMAKDFEFYLLSQTDIYGGHPKERESVSYVELDGEEIDKAPTLDEGKTVKQPFDYEVEFMVFSEILGEKNNGDYTDFSINKRIEDLNEALSRNNEITLFNTFKGQKIIGIYTDYEITTDERRKYNNSKDYKTVKFKFRVSKPNKCSYSLNNTDITDNFISFGLKADYDNNAL